MTKCTGDVNVVPSRVSVIVATHNGHATLERCVSSALAQAGDVECVVVDDGSDDATADLLRSLAGRHHRLRVLHNEVPSGRPAAPRNQGVQEAASGEFLIFLDDDDELCEGAVALHRHTIATAAVSYGDAIVDDGVTRGRASRLWGVGMDLPELCERNARPLHAMMIRRSWFERVGGFDERLRALEDWHLWLRVALDGGAFVSVAAVVCIYYPRPASESHWRSPAMALVEPTSKAAMLADLSARFPSSKRMLQPYLRLARIRLAEVRESAERENGGPSLLWRVQEAAFVLRDAGVGVGTVAYGAKSAVRHVRRRPSRAPLHS